jgi:hypothetical protein
VYFIDDLCVVEEEEGEVGDEAVSNHDYGNLLANSIVQGKGAALRSHLRADHEDARIEELEDGLFHHQHVLVLG